MSRASSASAATDRRLRFAAGVHLGKPAAAAAREAGYSGNFSQASRMLRHPAVVAELARLRTLHQKATVAEKDEVLRVLTEQLRFSIEDCLTFATEPQGSGDRVQGATKTVVRVDLEKAKAAGKLHLLQGLEIRADGTVTFKLADKQGAIDRLSKLCGWNAAEKHELRVGDPSQLSDEKLLEEAKRLGITGK